MTSRMVRWRSVRLLDRPPGWVSGVSVLSLMQTNLAQCGRFIKHVFEIGRVGVSRTDLVVTS